MATKPSYGATFNPSDTVGALLSHAWIFNEGSGSTVHDLVTSGGVNGTTAGTTSWTTTANGDSCLNVGAAASGVSLASAINLAAPFTVLFRATVATAGNFSMLLGSSSSSNSFIWLQPSTPNIKIPTTGAGYVGPSVNFAADTTNLHNWAYTYDGTNGLQIYQDGVLKGTTATGGGTTFVLEQFSAPAGAYTADGLQGNIDYIYTASGVMSSTNIGLINTSPYRIANAAPATGYTLSASPSSVNTGNAATITATITGGSYLSSSLVITLADSLSSTISGTITIANGSTTGTATVTPTVVGTHNITATHTGGGFTGSDGSTSFTGISATNATGFTLAASPSTVATNTASTVTATITGGTTLSASLVITLIDSLSSTISGTITIPNGSTTGTATITPTVAGSHAITSSHTGGGFTGGNGSTTIAASANATGYTLALSPTTVSIGTASTVTATITGGTFLGSSLVITLASSLGSTISGTITIANGSTTGTATVTPTANGTDSITATHTGGGFTGGDGSATLTAAPGTIALTQPVAYQPFQRSVVNKADITITGTYTGSPSAIEASWNGGSYQTIVSSPSGGTFSSKLPNQALGTGTLTVRFVGATTVSASAANVMVGDIYVGIGQSNMNGRLTNNQSAVPAGGFSMSTYNATNGGWITAQDPSGYGNASNASSEGSFFLLFLNQAAANTPGVPIAGLNLAIGSTTVYSWTTNSGCWVLYALPSLIAANVTACRAVLWQQGEQDAAAGTTQAAYLSALTVLAGEVEARFPNTPFVVAKLQNCAGWSYTSGATYTATTGTVAAINAALVQATTLVPNVQLGPDLSDLVPSNNPHFATNAEGSTVASRFWTSVSPLVPQVSSGSGTAASTYTISIPSAPTVGHADRVMVVTNQPLSTSTTFTFTDPVGGTFSGAITIGVGSDFGMCTWTATATGARTLTVAVSGQTGLSTSSSLASTPVAAALGTAYTVVGIPALPDVGTTYNFAVILNNPASASGVVTPTSASGLSWSGSIAVSSGAVSATGTVIFTQAGTYTPAFTHTGLGFSGDPTLSSSTASAPSSGSSFPSTAPNGWLNAAAFASNALASQTISTVSGNVNGNVGGNVVGSVNSVTTGVTLSSTAFANVTGIKGWNLAQMLRAVGQYLVGVRTGVPSTGTGGTVTFTNNSAGDYGTVVVDTTGAITSNNMTPAA